MTARVPPPDALSRPRRSHGSGLAARRTRRSGLVSLVAAALLLACPRTPDQIEVVTLASSGSPLVSIRLLWRAGSMDDPPGKEGLAALTALVVGRGGTYARGYAEVVEALYPMGVSLDVTTDREATVFAAKVHRETLAEFTRLLTEMILTPGLAPSDLERHRQLQEAYLGSTLRSGDDELLGLEAVQQRIFAGHSYGHSPAGTLKGLAAITIEDVRRFYESYYTQGNLILGVGGGYPPGFVEDLRDALGGLPVGRGPRPRPASPSAKPGRHFTLIEKATGSVGIHLGFGFDVVRGDPDYFPLRVASSAFGEHRSLTGRLMQRLRVTRGLNYGDYAYIEHWADPPSTTSPTADSPRGRQYFSIWLRPVEVANAHFAIRAALFELERLIEDGLSAEEFDLTRDYLVNASKLWAPSVSARLAFLMESRFYGGPPYLEDLERRLEAMSLNDVNEALRAHLQTEDLHVVLVVPEDSGLADAIAAERPSPMAYPAPPPADVAREDRLIEVLPLKPKSVEVVAAETLFLGESTSG